MFDRHTAVPKNAEKMSPKHKYTIIIFMHILAVLHMLCNYFHNQCAKT